MNRSDIQLLRRAALELHNSSDDLVRTAGVIQRIRNWWKARWDKDFREKSEKVQESYEQMKTPLNQLIQQLQKFENAAQSQSADEAARIAVELPSILSEIISEMRTLKQNVQSIESTVPTSYVDSETGESLTDDQRRWVAKNYRKNKELLTEMFNSLPPMFREEIPIGKPIGRQISDFSWYRQYTPNNVALSDTVKSRIKDDLFTILRKEGFGEDVIKILTESYPVFLDNIREAIVSDAVLMSVNWPSVSKQVGHRPSNQMKLHLNLNEVPFPIKLPNGSETSINIGIGDILAIDMGTALASTNFKLSIMGIRGLNLSPQDKSSLDRIKREHDDQKRRSRQRPMRVRDDELTYIDDNQNEVTSSGPIASLVKKALIRKALPITQAVVKVSGQTFHHKVRFAKVLSSALRQEIDAECSVHCAGNDVEVQVQVSGSKFSAIPAIYGISVHVADKFINATKVGVDVDVAQGTSTLGLMNSSTLDQSLRRVSFDLRRLS